MDRNAMMPYGYDSTKHDSLDAFDAASDIADLTWSGEDDTYIDAYIYTIARRIEEVRAGAR